MGQPGASAVDEPSAPAAPEPEAAPDDLTVIKGIGPVRSGHLADEGITTFADLAAADPTTLAEQFDVGETAAAAWVAEAA